MPLLILTVVFFTLLWMVWTVIWLFWPIALLIGAAVLLRGQRRHWQRLASEQSEPATPYRQRPSSGNRAFDEYRDEALHALDEERGKFGEFLERLRKSKDKADFDRFVADRRQRPSIEGPQGAGA
ncbi:MAG: DUF2852 domain-containing protein [Hyphomicrobium sp.]